MLRYLIIQIFAAAIFVGVLGCKSKLSEIPPGGYRVSVKTVKDHNSLLIQKIAITTKGKRYWVLSEGSGYNSSSIGPSITDKKKYQVVDIMLIATLTYSAQGGQRELVVSMVSETKSGTTYCSQTISVDKSFTLKNLKVRKVEGVFSERQMLLRAESENDYIELYITKGLSDEPEIINGKVK
jgi:hypothetical protein